MGRWGTNQYMTGSVDELRIWGGILSATEVVSNYYAGTGIASFIVSIAMYSFIAYFL